MKLRLEGEGILALKSPPVRRRGLKPIMIVTDWEIAEVASRAEAWIET